MIGGLVKLPLRAAGFALDVRRRSLACVLVGCEWSWTLGAQYGTRPVCRRCGSVHRGE